MEKSDTPAVQQIRVTANHPKLDELISEVIDLLKWHKGIRAMFDYVVPVATLCAVVGLWMCSQLMFNKSQ
jgi:hypothetical protein